MRESRSAPLGTARFRRTMRQLHTVLVVAGFVASCVASTGCGGQRYLRGSGHYPGGTIEVTVRPAGSGAVLLRTEEEAVIQVDSLRGLLRKRGKIAIEAFPMAGWRFERWEGAVTDSSSRETELVPGHNRRAVCVFSPRDSGE